VDFSNPQDVWIYTFILVDCIIAVLVSKCYTYIINYRSEDMGEDAKRVIIIVAGLILGWVFAYIADKRSYHE
jgi:hypothetical protein